MKEGLRKFFRQPIRAAALIFILLCALLAIFGYMFVGDKTPQINEQIPAISLQDPGFKVHLLKIPKENAIPQKSFLSALFFGSPSVYTYLPLTAYNIDQDSIHYRVFEAETSASSMPLQSRSIISLLQGKDSIAFINKQLSAEEIQKDLLTQRIYLFGTDIFGRSIFDRVIIGLRFSLIIGLLAVLISITIGLFIGMVAGYFGGWVDALLNYLMNVFWSIPTLILVFAIVLVTGRGIQNIFLAVGLTMWVDAARLVRGQVIGLRNEKYIQSVKSFGMSSWRIIFRHILPNMLGPLIVVSIANFASAIIIESGLSYLGFGIQPPSPSLGSLLAENYGFILSGKPMLALIPVLILLLLVLSFNLVGNGIRDIFDVKSEVLT